MPPKDYQPQTGRFIYPAGKSVILLTAVLMLYGLTCPAVSAQDDTCCFEAYKSCGACQDNPDPQKRTENLSYQGGTCTVYDYYGKSASNPAASAKLKACQQCIEQKCPVGLTKPGASSNQVQIILPQGTIRPWCSGAQKNIARVKQTPEGRSPAEVMVRIDAGGAVTDAYDLDEGAYNIPDKSLVSVPDESGWRVYVRTYPQYPDSPDAELDFGRDTLFRFGCERDTTFTERLKLGIELSKGDLNLILNAITATPEYQYEVATGAAFISFRSTTPKGAVPRWETETAKGFSQVEFEPLAQRARARFNVDVRQSGLTRITVSEGIVEVTPANSSLRPFLLRSGQQVQVSQTSVSPIIAVNGGSTGAGPSAGISGTWVTPNGDTIVLTQRGNRVTGTYRGALGTGALTGTFDGRTLSGSIEVGQGALLVQDTFSFRLTPDGRLEGHIGSSPFRVDLILSRR